jgi:hypothetical protein
MSIRDEEPMGWRLDFSGDWHEVWEDDDQECNPDDDTDEESYGESCLTVAERN